MKLIKYTPNMFADEDSTESQLIGMKRHFVFARCSTNATSIEFKYLNTKYVNTFPFFQFRVQKICNA